MITKALCALLLCACASHVTLGQVVTSLSRDKSIVSGGLEMDVRGSGFAAGQSPMAVVTMYYRSEPAQRFRGLECSMVSSSRLSCNLPGVTLPADYTPPNVTAQEVARLNAPGVFDFKVGVTFDTSQAHREFQALGLYADPWFRDNVPRTFNVWTYPYITMRGLALLDAAGEEDYSVTITDKPCIITEFNTTLIRCQLPLDPPAKDFGNYSTIRVNVGNHVSNVGRIWYRVPVFANGGPALPVLDFEPRDFTAQILVNGEGVMVGLNDTNYEARLGQSECFDIVMTPTSLSCRGPATSPPPTTLVEQHEMNYPQLVLRVPKQNLTVFSYTYHVAYVRYTNHDYSRDSSVAGDSAGPGAADSFDYGNPAPNPYEDEGEGSVVTIVRERETRSDKYTLWVVLGLCLAFAALLGTLLCCCCCCPACCGRNAKWSEYESSRLVSREESHPSRRTISSPTRSQPGDTIVAEYSLRPNRIPTYF